MKRILVLCGLVMVAFALFVKPEPVAAQRYAFDPFAGDSVFSVNRDYYRKRSFRNNRQRAKKLRRQRAAKIGRRLKRARLRRNKLRQARQRKARKKKKDEAATTKATQELASLGQSAKTGNFGKTGKPAGASSRKKAGREPVQIVVSLPRQRVRVYRGSKVIASARVSTGRQGHRTPAGIFSIIQKNRRHFSNLYDDAPMPYMQRITWSGLALHGGNVKRPYASHGCVRLPHGFARRLFRNTTMGAHVIISSGAPRPRLIKHDNLFQPVARSGVQTAALNEGETRVDTPRPPMIAAKSDLKGLPGFIRPRVKSARRLAEKQQVLKGLEDREPSLVARHKAVKADHDAKQGMMRKAVLAAVRHNKKLKKPRRSLVHASRRLSREKARLKNAQRRAIWAWEIVEKRRDDPRYAGASMNKAVARAEKRDRKLVALQKAFDEVNKKFEAARAAYTAIKDENARLHTGATGHRQQTARALEELKQAESALQTHRSALKKTRHEVRVEKRQLREAKAREKMPLRILITKRNGNERVKEVQRLLTRLGYDTGGIDGVIGKGTRGAIRQVQALSDRKPTGGVDDQLVEDLYRLTGQVKTANAHLYVRQGFLDLFDAPVHIKEPEKPLGTHVYTAMAFGKTATSVQWTALTSKYGARLSKKNGRRARKASRKSRKPQSSRKSAAHHALDRLEIPANVRNQVVKLLTSGSSMVLSDKGMSWETGKGTDFVVLTK